MIRRYVIRIISSHLWGMLLWMGDGLGLPHPLLSLCATVQPLCVNVHVDQWIQSVATLHTKHTHTLHACHQAASLVPTLWQDWYLKFTLLGCGKDQWLDIVNMYIVLHSNKILYIYLLDIKELQQ